MTNPPMPLLDLTETPCASCRQVSAQNEEMISCDDCQRWYHIRCVGISDAKKDDTWYCTEESCQRTKRKISRGKKNDDDSDRSSVKSDRTLALESKMKAMEEKQKRMEQELEMEMKIKQKEMEFTREIEIKRMLMEKQLREEEEEAEKLLQERILQQRKEQFNRMKARQQSFEDEIKAMNETMKKLQKSTEKKPTTKPLDAGDGRPGMDKKSSNPIGKLTKQNLRKLKTAQSKDSDEGNDIDNEDGTESEDEQNDVGATSSDGSEKCGGSKKRKATKKSDKLSQHTQGQTRPTKTQLAARNGISKKLPVFSGKPEEWPLFYGMYQASNEACGYSDIENLVRLQECLKGPALEMVRGQLLCRNQQEA